MTSTDPQPRAGRLGWRLLLGVLALIFALWLAGRVVDWLWLGELGYRQVFWRLLGVQVGLFLAAFVPLALYFWANLRAALSAAASWQPASGAAEALARYGRAPLLRHGLPIGLALLFALAFAGAWDEALRLAFGGGFGTAEPLFGRDAGFYVFRLPLLDTGTQLVLTAALLMLALQVGLHYGLGAFASWRSLDAGRWRRSVALIGWNLILAAAAAGASYLLETYRLLYASGGTVIGPGYTDAKVVVPALWVMAGVMAALVAVSVVALRRAQLAWVAAGVAGAAGAHLLALWVVPGLVQSFVVDPNEFARERPYLETNIAFTRHAFGIDDVAERDYAGSADLERADLEDNRDTVRNIRLWDYRPLLRTFRQIQQIRLYYRFYDADVDRYRLADGYRQVLLSARELTPDLPERADTWVNRHLQYTHGYGLAMSLAAQEGGQGSPTLIVKDLPPVAERGLEVETPAIYFGEHMSGFRIVPSDIREFDHPAGDDNVYVRYRGTGGVPIGSFWSQLLFALHLSDVNILLTEYIDDDSRIQIRRPLQERIRAIAPFLRLDRDPYLVSAADGIYWIQDAYTVSDTFPYSEAYGLRPETGAGRARGRGGPVNYIRNSVKIAVDAYDGDVSFHVMDPDDPVLAAYRAAFPELFRPLSALPAGLEAHLRYPQDLFEAQVARYAAYHMRDPQVFYNNEDLWAVPREKYGGSSIVMEPYYILMRLPGEERLQFMLMMPLTPAGRDNMIAWIAARADFPGYGEMVAFKLPKERLVFGPMQVEALIDQDTEISRRLSLWDQRGSRVIRGNLLAIPIDHALLYVEPVYLVAEENDVPQLKRVIVAQGDRVAMEPTLERAIAALFGEAGPAPKEAPPRAPAPELVSELRTLIGDAEAALSRGDWAGFGAAMERLKRALPAQSGTGPEAAAPGDGS